MSNFPTKILFVADGSKKAEIAAKTAQSWPGALALSSRRTGASTSSG